MSRSPRRGARMVLEVGRTQQCVPFTRPSLDVRRKGQLRHRHLNPAATGPHEVTTVAYNSNPSDVPPSAYLDLILP